MEVAKGGSSVSRMAPVIEVRQLFKTFGKTRALDGVDLDLQSGEVLGFLGPNGAGKTTTLRCLLGLLRADASTMRVLGMDAWADAVALHKRLAYVPGDVALWPNLTGGEVIDFLGRLRGGLNEGRRQELIERLQLDPSRRTRTYSKGNRQKVALIAALASNAELLLLDEPTSGLDPLMERVFRELITEWKGDGRAVLLSSHILSEAEALSDRISIIRDGRIVETGTLADMRHLLRTNVTASLRTTPVGFDAMAGVHNCVTHENTLTCSVDQGALDTFIGALQAFGIASLSTQPPTLEELFLSHYAAPRNA